MLLQLTDFSTEPLYRQISQQMGERIRRGDLSAGKPLDPLPAIAREQRVSVSTVKRAFEELHQAGFVEPREDNFVVSARFKKSAKFRKHAVQPEMDHSFARRIQESLLPPAALCDKNVTITAASHACEFVNGDMYDYFQIDKNRYGIVIADACGHGVSAALLTSQIQAILKSEIKNGTPIRETMTFINAHIRASFVRGKFITLFYGIYDARERSLTYINAGHNFPLLVRKDGAYSFLTNSSPALGLADDITFVKAGIQINPGDKLVLYTDGITEAMNSQYEELGEERLLRFAQENRALSPEELINAIFGLLSSHVSAHKNSDDRTLMILHVKEPAQTKARCA